jgi:protein-S-isoprenylcysteine O-methyltransferase Ste14
MLQPTQDSRSIGELLADLMREISTLVREEVSLAKSEMSQKAALVGKDVGMMAVGGVLAFAGYLAVQDAAVLALSNVMPVWAASLVVGLVVIAIAAAIAIKGLNSLKRQNLAPQQTVETLKEDVQWAKQQVK